MIRVHQRKAVIGIPAGIVAMVIGKTLLSSDDGPMQIVGVLVAVAGLIAFWWGCVQLAKAKGYPGWPGAVLGLLNFIGIIVLGLLPDKHKAAT